MKLFDFQDECVDQLLAGFSRHRVQCLAWYTGAGKTNVFSEMCRALVESNQKVKIGISAYLTKEIKEQVAERLAEFGLKDVTHTVVAGERLLDRNILVFNPQGVYRNLPDVIFDYLIIDESHAGLEKGTLMLRKIMKETCGPKTKVLLVSATPWDTLALDEFKGCPVFKRPLDQGLADGLITDFKFHAEAAQITFSDNDFTRKGDLGRSAAQREMAILKSACIGKLKNLVEKYDRKLGKKVLVICPVGNFTEVPRTMAEEFGGLTFLQNRFFDVDGTATHDVGREQDNNLRRFKSDPSVRFLFVANKCQVGFDMQELSSVVDLTMSRNVKVLAQRIGRIARKNGRQEKHYFYVYDQSLMKDRLEWLVATMIDFSLGAYDGWTTRTAKYRKIKIGHWAYREPFATTLSEVVSALRDPAMVQNQRTLAYVAPDGPPTKWTIPMAIEAARAFSSRTEMWEKRPALYKWFRLNAKAEMDAIFPLKHHMGKWNKESVIEALKKCKTRKDFKLKFSGAQYWMETKLTPEERELWRQKYIGESRSAVRWDNEKIMLLLRRLRTWAHIRTYGGARRWMADHKGELFWKRKWEQIHRKTYSKDVAPRYSRAKHAGYAHAERKKDRSA